MSMTAAILLLKDGMIVEYNGLIGKWILLDHML